MKSLRSILVEVADASYAVSFGARKMDDFDALQEVAKRTLYHTPTVVDLFASSMFALAAAKWCETGFPAVTLSEKLLFSLLATKVPASMIDRVQMPWPAFVVTLPPNTLFLADPVTGDPSPINFVLMSTLNIHEEMGEDGVRMQRWGYNAVADNNISLDHTGLKQLLWDESEGQIGTGIFSTYDMTTPDFRTQVLLRRLMVNMCLSLSDRSKWKQQTKSRLGKLRQTKDPIRREYVYVGDVTYDARSEVRDYYAGKRGMSALSVQSIVAGHWKQQVCGPARKCRKEIWIQPYWRGPEDALIAVHMDKE